jgi:restriction endonuclease S subunit
MIPRPHSLAQLRPNPGWAKLPLFDRKGWKTVRFGEFAESVNERVEPSTAAEEIYVGLDDLDSGSLHIRRWGKGSDVIGTKLRFRKGDIIFGRRRAYQRKLAVAEMDGICSAHAMVVRARPSVVLPEFLPFLMMSDQFMNRAVEISVGSLSPTINWTTLKREPFTLPTLEHQRRIARILRAVNEVACAWEASEQSIRTLQRALLREAFENSNGRWPTKALGDVARVERGMFSHRPRNLPEFYGGEFPFVQTGDVQNADRFLTHFEYHLTELGTTYSKSFPAGTIFVTIAAVIGATAISDREVFVTDSVVGVVPSESMNVDYLELFLRSKRHFLENQAATQTAQKNINLQVLRPLLVPCPPRAVQERIASEILEPFHAAKEAETHVKKTRALLNSLANQIVGTTP